MTLEIQSLYLRLAVVGLINIMVIKLRQELFTLMIDYVTLLVPTSSLLLLSLFFVVAVFVVTCKTITRARKHHNELINARESPAQVKKIIETSKINMMYFV